MEEQKENMRKKFNNMLKFKGRPGFYNMYDSWELKEVINWYLTLPEKKQELTAYVFLLKTHYGCMLNEELKEESHKNKIKRLNKKKLKNGEPLSEDEVSDKEGEKEKEEEEAEDGDDSLTDSFTSDEEDAYDKFGDLMYEYGRDLDYDDSEELLSKMKRIAAGKDEDESSSGEEEELKHKPPTPRNEV